ncbi:2-C-methyl-D-erythritol 4-phosphate cytidylyltransferase [Pseudokineococcus sp. 1T1Z-3]|uniref:2-C-methyl-D-erythritol 4-phosphate cytidylyltransferase n=1 Tax=Pseudokineococcus sp. 1T1Z-3 TaxID=3132745 RepID=UPI0030B1BF3F
MLVAAGAGVRLAAGRPKAFVTVGDVALLVHAARGLAAARVVDRLVVVVPVGLEGETRQLLRDVTGAWSCAVVAGGATRQASVAAGLAVVEDAGVVLVHDAARAFTPPEVVARVVAAVRAGHDAVVPAVAVHDTLRDVTGAVVDRSRLRAVQTPQGFSVDVLRRAHAVPAAGRGATDDAGLVEATGVLVRVVDGHGESFKVTTPLDLVLAAALLVSRADVAAPLPGTPS